MDLARITDKIEFVDTPKGRDQDESIGVYKDIHVDQWTNGRHTARTSRMNTNTIEGYWGLIKNGIKGNFRSLSKKYLPFYLVEYDYKYNNRKTPATQFEDFIKRALTDESCLLNYKPKKDVKEIVYG